MNYEFLMDEEYQQIKHEKEQVQQQKWQLMGQKLAVKLALNSVHSSLDSLNMFLTKQKTASQQLMFYCDETMKTKSSSFSMGSGILSYQQEISMCHYEDEQKYQKNNLNIKDLFASVNQISKKVEKKVQGLVKNQCEILLKFEKERERSEYLTREIQRKDSQRSNKQSNNDIDTHQESYIEDLEVQLQESRASLLDKKIKLTDKEEEIRVLKKQIEGISMNFMQLEDEKKEIEGLVIRVSQQLKGKEFGIQDFNYQLSQEKEHLAKQVEMMAKQYHEEKDRVKNLEMIEGDLLHKLETTSADLGELKKYAHDLQEKLELKTDAIEKAHKVIQRLNEEMEKGGQMMGKIESEKDLIKKENKDLNKKVIELNKQIQNNINHQYISNAQINNKMKGEVEELKDALRQYQQEYEQEKRMLMDSVRDLNEQKFEIQQEKDKQDQQNKKIINQLQEDIDQKDKQIEENEVKIRKYDKDLKELEEHYQTQLNTREQSAQSNMMYMQRRLKEITADDNQNKNGQRQQKNIQVPQTAYLLQVKQEFDNIADEFLEIRSLIKSECIDKSSITHKIGLFEDFKTQFLDHLISFETKATELSELSQKYEKQLDEYKKLFLTMRTLIKEKDLLIYSQQKQLLTRDQALRNNFGVLAKEIERGNFIMGAEMIEMLRKKEGINFGLRSDKEDMEKRFGDFKNDYLEILEDRDSTKNENLRLSGQLEMYKRDIEYLQDDYRQFKETLKSILNIKNSSQDDIFTVVESLSDELRVRRDEVIQYKSQIKSYESSSDEEKKFLCGRIQAVENQLEVIQSEALNREEEMQVQYLQKETRYINEVQRLQTECSGALNEAQLREKQSKKVQDKVSSLMMKVEMLEKEREQLRRDKDDLIDREERMGEEIRGIQTLMERTQEELNYKNESMELMEQQMKQQEEKQKYLNESIFDKDDEIKKERELNMQLQDEKFKQNSEMEKFRDTYRVLEKENHSLYQELKKYKDHIGQLQSNIQVSEYERDDLKRAYSQMSQVVQQAQEEVLQSHQAIEDLTQKVQESKYKDSYIEELREEIKSFAHQEAQLTQEVDVLKKQLNPEKVNMEVQTRDSGMQELVYMRDEMKRCKNDAWGWGKEAEQLRESIKRQTLEVDRLIDEKRELEDLVDQQNQSIKQIRFNQTLKDNTSIHNNYSKNNSQVDTHIQSIMSQSNNNTSTELYTKILQEKENYIMRLENELGDMRKEIESLKNKLLMHEINKSSIGMFGSITNENKKMNSQHKYQNRTASIHKDEDSYMKYR